MYIRNISRHDFLLKVVTKKLWKILQQKNIVKTGKKNWSEKKKEGNFTVLSSLHQTFSSDLA